MNTADQKLAFAFWQANPCDLKRGGQEQAEKDFDKLNGIEVGQARANGTRIKLLPDGTRAALRPSKGGGRPTVARQSPPKGAPPPLLGVDAQYDTIRR